MYTNQRQTQDTKELRRIGGRWLKERRERAGLSQRQLADILGVEYYTFISQIETGHGRIPPDRYEAWASAIGVSLSEFVREIMRYYDPITYHILFSNTPDIAINNIIPCSISVEYRQMQEQVRELQRLLGQKTMELELAREHISRLKRTTGEKLDIAHAISAPDATIKKRASVRSKKHTNIPPLSSPPPFNKAAD